VERVFIRIGAALLAVVMVIGAVDIVAGELFGLFLPFKVDMSGTLCAAAIFLSWPAIERKDDHIAVDLFDGVTPDWLKTCRRWLALAAAFVVFALMTKGMWAMAWASLAVRETSAATLGYPIWPAKIACAVGVTAVLITLTFKAIAMARGQKSGAGV